MLLISSLKGHHQTKEVETNSGGCSALFCCLDPCKISEEVLVQQASLAHPEWPYQVLQGQFSFPAPRNVLSLPFPNDTSVNLKPIQENIGYRTLWAFRLSKCSHSKAYWNIFWLENHNYTWSKTQRLETLKLKSSWMILKILFQDGKYKVVSCRDKFTDA